VFSYNSTSTTPHSRRLGLIHISLTVLSKGSISFDLLPSNFTITPAKTTTSARLSTTSTEHNSTSTFTHKTTHLSINYLSRFVRTWPSTRFSSPQDLNTTFETCSLIEKSHQHITSSSFPRLFRHAASGSLTHHLSRVFELTIEQRPRRRRRCRSCQASKLRKTLELSCKEPVCFCLPKVSCKQTHQTSSRFGCDLDRFAPRHAGPCPLLLS